jgi:hypothetical protein
MAGEVKARRASSPKYTGSYHRHARAWPRGLTRASTSLSAAKTWMAGTSLDEPGHDVNVIGLP